VLLKNKVNKIPIEISQNRENYVFVTVTTVVETGTFDIAAYAFDVVDERVLKESDRIYTEKPTCLYLIYIGQRSQLN
jgi:hypothetical protein